MCFTAPFYHGGNGGGLSFCSKQNFHRHAKSRGQFQNLLTAFEFSGPLPIRNVSLRNSRKIGQLLLGQFLFVTQVAKPRAKSITSGLGFSAHVPTRIRGGKK